MRNHQGDRMNSPGSSMEYFTRVTFIRNKTVFDDFNYDIPLICTRVPHIASSTWIAEKHDWVLQKGANLALNFFGCGRASNAY